MGLSYNIPPPLYSPRSPPHPNPPKNTSCSELFPRPVRPSHTATTTGCCCSTHYQHALHAPHAQGPAAAGGGAKAGRQAGSGTHPGWAGWRVAWQSGAARGAGPQDRWSPCARAVGVHGLHAGRVVLYSVSRARPASVHAQVVPTPADARRAAVAPGQRGELQQLMPTAPGRGAGWGGVGGAMARLHLACLCAAVSTTVSHDSGSRSAAVLADLQVRDKRA